jgi:hypothetical protein
MTPLTSILTDISKWGISARLNALHDWILMLVYEGFFYQNRMFHLGSLRFERRVNAEMFNFYGKIFRLYHIIMKLLITNKSFLSVLLFVIHRIHMLKMLLPFLKKYRSIKRSIVFEIWTFLSNITESLVLFRVNLDHHSYNIENNSCTYNKIMFRIYISIMSARNNVLGVNDNK